MGVDASLCPYYPLLLHNDEQDELGGNGAKGEAEERHRKKNEVPESGLDMGLGEKKEAKRDSRVLVGVFIGLYECVLLRHFESLWLEGQTERRAETETRWSANNKHRGREWWRDSQLLESVSLSILPLASSSTTDKRAK